MMVNIKKKTVDLYYIKCMFENLFKMYLEYNYLDMFQR